MSSEATRAIEAVLMVAQEPVEPQLLAQLLELPVTRVEELCAELQAAYEADQRGFVLVRVAGGYRYQSHGDLAAYVERFVLEGQTAKLSSAALETLAIVAYKQPLSRAQVAAIRGVNVDGVMRTLQQRGYIAEIGRDAGPGQATLFGTTNEFLERVGLDRIEDLPPINELFPSADVMEALEQGLLADRPSANPVPEPVPEPTAEPTEPADPTEPLASPIQTVEPPIDLADPALDLVAAEDAAVIDLDDRPEPEPPAWAVDPEPSATEPVEAREPAEPAEPDEDAGAAPSE